MFGYIKPDTPNLLVRENEQYKAVYCSLCKALGVHYGRLARMTLSYDCTFYALFLLGQQSQCCGFVKGRCTCNPLKKCTFAGGTEEQLKLPAALSVLSMVQKLKDTLQDDGFFRKMAARLLLPFTRKAYKKAKADYPELAQALEEMTKQQRAVEEARETSLDGCAEPTAKMLSVAFSLACKAEEELPIYKTLGYFVGKWVYVMDAADDLEEDIAKGGFNPLVLSSGLTKESTAEEILAVRTSCNYVLNPCVAQMLACMDLLSFPQFAGILGNIVERGLPEMQRKYLFEKEKKA